MYYITIIDPPGGVYQSQVIDVVKKLNTLSDTNVRLVAFLPIQKFKINKSKIRNLDSEALIIPMIFGASRWKWLKIFYYLFLSKKRTAIGRGPLPSYLNLGYFKKTIYDGRAAVKAETEEYDIAQNKALNLQFIEAEKQSVLHSDFRIAVSNQLVKYWGKIYGYSADQHVVIPCTLSSKTDNPTFTQDSEDVIKIVYSGGIGGWQSFDLVVKVLEEALNNQANIEVLFLTQETEEVNSLIKKFPNRCERKWLKHEEVYNVLKSCDYGILIRDDKWTNRVASPVKFAEYLNAGLKVLISEHIGDFSEFAQTNNAGVIIKDEIPQLESISSKEKQRLNKLCAENFLKSTQVIEGKFQQLVDCNN